MNKAQRRRRRLIRRIIVTAICVVFALVILVAVLRIKTLRAFRGDYVRSIDVTDVVVAEAAIWLSDVEGADIDTDWIRDKTDRLYVQADLSFTSKGLSSGSFTEEIDNPSYAECEAAAYGLVAECLRELIIRRLTAVGYAESVTEAEADSLIKEALGMTLDNYIKNAGISFMPEYNELSDQINRSGDYRIRKKTIKWERGGEEVTDAFSVAGDRLVITEPELIYTR